MRGVCPGSPGAAAVLFCFSPPFAITFFIFSFLVSIFVVFDTVSCTNLDQRLRRVEYAPSVLESGFVLNLGSNTSKPG
jgi:hypothetical protein